MLVEYPGSIGLASPWKVEIIHDPGKSNVDGGEQWQQQYAGTEKWPCNTPFMLQIGDNKRRQQQRQCCRVSPDVSICTFEAFVQPSTKKNKKPNLKIQKMR
jgi:hypothetical protein